MYIDNTDINKPLIYGEFDNDLVKIHGTLEMAEAVAVSDVRLKKNIQPLNASLDKIYMLEGVSLIGIQQNMPTGAYPMTSRSG